MNWKGQETLVALGVKVKSVAKTVETNGYTLYALADKK